MRTRPLLNFAGPVAQNVKAEGAKTRDEFADLANSKTIPEHKAATGQNLTRRATLVFHIDNVANTYTRLPQHVLPPPQRTIDFPF